LSARRSSPIWALGLLWCALLASAAGTIYSKYRARALFVQLERLNQVRDSLDADWGRLQLEQSAWSSYAFVERVASERLHMLAPDPRDIAIVTPSPAAAVAVGGAP
jgi:cell division protein FtsL